MTPISTISERPQPLNLIEVIKPLAILVTQVAIRVIFISSVILITSALFPYAVQPILIPIVAVSSAFFSAFFFIRGKDLRPPLSKEVLSTIDLTKKLPKGLTNDRNNCWMNALIQTFVSDPSFLASIDKKQESSDPLTKALVRIVNSYKSASIFDDSVVEENSQMVREALHSISLQFCSSSSAVQEDAALNMVNILEKILNEENIAQIESQYKYEIDGLPKIALYPIAETGITKTPMSVIQLPLNPEAPPANLQNLLDCFYRDRIEHKQRGSDGKEYDYPGEIVRNFINCPPVLRFQLGRFGYNNKAFKIKVPVEIPENIEITLKTGEKKAYQLRSFINHHGDELESGHYTAYRKIGSEMYWMNDNNVTKINESRWKKARDESYIVSYELVDDSQLKNRG